MNITLTYALTHYKNSNLMRMKLLSIYCYYIIIMAYHYIYAYIPYYHIIITAVIIIMICMIIACVSVKERRTHTRLLILSLTHCI